MTPSSSETVSLRDLLAVVRRGRRWLLYGVVAGLAVALAVSWILPPRYDSEATVVLRDRSEGASTGGMGLAGMSEDLGKVFSSLPSLPGSLGSNVDTELEVLDSRDMLRRTVRDVGLTVRVMSPRETPVHEIFRGVEPPDRVEDPVDARFERREDGSYRVKRPEGDTVVAPGGTVSVAGARLTLRADRDLPGRFRVRVDDVQGTVERIVEDDLLQVELAGGDVASVTFSAPEAGTAARAANRLVSLYLEDRKERLASLHRQRLDILAGVSDSLRIELAAATEAYRVHQQERGTFEPEGLGDLERVAVLQAEVDEVEVEARAMDELLRRATAEDVRPQDLLGVAGLAGSDALSRLLDRLYQVRTERQSRLAWLTEEDPEVQALDESAEYLQEQLVSMARSYREGLHRRLAQMRSELERYRGRLARRPAEEERDFVLEKDVERIMASFLGVQAQMVQERLATIAEGADLRQVDEALPPKEPEFPDLPLNLALGLLGGLLVGGVGAVAGGTMSRRVSDPAQVESVLGLPAVTLADGAPLLLGGVGEAGVVLVVPVGGSRGSERVARRLAETASLRTSRAALLDLSGDEWPGLPPLLPERFRQERSEGGGRYHVLPHNGEGGPLPDTGEVLSPPEALEALQRVGDDLSPIFIALPDASHPLVAALTDPRRPVVLVARLESPAMEDLRELSVALGRVGVPVLGVVLHRD